MGGTEANEILILNSPQSPTLTHAPPPLLLSRAIHKPLLRRMNRGIRAIMGVGGV
jgi:hypothetical protein